MDKVNIIICTPGRLLQHMDENPLFCCDNMQVSFAIWLELNINLTNNKLILFLSLVFLDTGVVKTCIKIIPRK